MKTASASLVAIFAGWAAALAVMATRQLVATGRTIDLGPTGFWVGLYALAAWALVVFPLMRLFGKRKIFSDLRFSWLSWGLLAVAIYAALSSLLFGKDVFEIIWYPAIMGCVAGFVFALLARNTAHSEAPMSGHDLQR